MNDHEALSNEQIKLLLCELDRIARDYDMYEYGLPLHDPVSRERMAQAVRAVASLK